MLEIDCTFPGGNILVDGIEEDQALIRQDQRGSVTPWFYWHFRVRGAAGRMIRFRFTEWNVIGTRGPAVSRDGGETYHWLGRECVDGSSFRYSFAVGETETYFCFCLPYRERELRRFLSEGGKHLRQETLCKTPKGRHVEMLRYSPSGDVRSKLLLTSRHHACETSANFVLEGVLSNLTDWLREHVEILAIPFVDKDGVEDGDQGKARNGRDHNRDYADQSIYAETAALREYVPRWVEGSRWAAFDLHCPWIRGTRNEDIYLVGSPDAARWKAQSDFAERLESVSKGPLPYRMSSNLPFGQDWNVGSNYQGLSSVRWLESLPGLAVASTIEIPYANVANVLVSPENLREFGRDLADGMGKYLQECANALK